MEKPATRSKNRLWKAVQSAVTFRNRADVIAHRPKAHHNNKGFSGPIARMIPAEARRKPKNFENQEPTSPKVSCIGQIKHGAAHLPRDSKPGQRCDKHGPDGPNPEMIKKKQSGFKKMLFRGGAGRKSDASIDRDRAKAPTRGATPKLMQMRRFASSRDALAGFDWTAAAQISPAENRESHSDGEDEVVIPFSAPITFGRQRNREKFMESI